jgi:CRISPR-associated exonuclease Cas4
MPLLVLLLFIFGLALLVWSERRRKDTGLPRGRLIASDTGDWGPVEGPLYDRHLALTGKPDYLVDTGDFLVPVEVKSTPAPPAPYDSHILQLAAYCLLVESHYGRRPPYGILRYANRSFAIDYTEALEFELLSVLDQMRLLERKRTVDRSHDQPARCAGCGYRGLCEQRL